MMKTKMIARGGGQTHAICSKYYCQSVAIAIKKVAVGSNAQWRRKSYAASVPSSDEPSDARRRGRRRVSKDERHAMVQSFVNKYREMNAGKFPTASAAQKQVGGSYYTIRKIIQGLEYNSKFPPLDGRKGSPLIEAKDGGPQLSSVAENTFSEEVSENVNAEEVSPSCLKKPDDGESQLLKEETKGVSHPCLEISGDVKNKEAQGYYSGFAATEDCELVEETKKVLPPCLENSEEGKKEQAIDGDLPNVDGLEAKVEQYQGSIEQDKVAKDTSSRQTNDAEVPKQPSLWGSVKSFADGIFRMWRKM